MTAFEMLVEYITTLTPEQAAKLVNHLDMIKRIVGMTDNEQIFLDSFIGQVFGKVGA